MKRILIAAAVAAATASIFATPAFAADVGVSVNIGQPGFYGRLDIGDYPPPQVIYRRPIAIEQVPMESPPVYLRVPPGHAKHWRQHCREYNACGERVLFVQDKWYNREYVPRYQEQHRERREDGRDVRRDDRRGEQGNERRGGDQNQGHGHNR